MCKIMDLIHANADEHDYELGQKFNADPMYAKAQETYEELIDTLEKRTKLDIDSAASTMETVASTISFNEGFNLATKLILSSLGGDLSCRK